MNYIFFAFIFWLVFIFLYKNIGLANLNYKLNLHNSINDNLKYLDSIRGLACLIVLGFHISIFNTPNHEILHQYFPPFGQGQKAVAIFFVLSGFLISRLFILKNFSILSFYLKRILRLWPLHIFITFLYYFTNIPLLNAHPERFLKELFLIQTNFSHVWNGVAWSIILEARCYFITPIIYFIKKKINRIFLLIIILFLLIISEKFNLKIINDADWIKFYFMGLFIGEFYENNLDGKLKKLFFFIGLSLVILDFLLIMPEYGCYGITNSAIDNFCRSSHTSHSTQIGIGSCLLILFYSKSKLINKFFENELLIFLGIISYSLYLSTFWGLGFYSDYAKQLNLIQFSLSFFFIFIPIHIVLSLILFLLFEKLPRIVIKKFI